MQQQESMKQENGANEQLINSLFESKYFAQRFYELQIRNNQELLKYHGSNAVPNQIHHVQNWSNLNTSTPDSKSQLPKSSLTQEEVEKSSTQLICEDEVINEISDVLLFNLKQSIFKETNTILESKLSIISITEEIQSIKQCLSKMNQNSFLAKASTQQSISPQKDERYKDKANKNDSLFLNGEIEESFISGNSKKLSEDKPSNFSFMSSFLNEQKIAQDQEILNQRINASISKMESSIEDRISQVEKEFTRRIQQIMKTIKNLISMINQNEATPKFNPQNHPHQHQPSNSKSSITLTKSEIGPSQSISNTLFTTTAKNSKQQKNILNVSSSKLSSFFKVRKN